MVNEAPSEVEALLQRERYRRLHELLTSGRVEIRVVPKDRVFLHGKAGVIEAADLRLPPAAVPAAFLPAIGEAQALIQTIKEETRAQNYSQASQAAALLENLIMRSGINLGRQTWYAANRALWEYELLVRERPENVPAILRKLLG